MLSTKCSPFYMIWRICSPNRGISSQGCVGHFLSATHQSHCQLLPSLKCSSLLNVWVMSAIWFLACLRLRIIAFWKWTLDWLDLIFWCRSLLLCKWSASKAFERGQQGKPSFTKMEYLITINGGVRSANDANLRVLATLLFYMTTRIMQDYDG